jgi:hypothetical protein
MVPPRGFWGGRDPMGLLEVKVREGCDQRRDQFLCASGPSMSDIDGSRRL